jgi:hypothetical protein
VPFGEVATLFIHVFPFLSGGGTTPSRLHYFFYEQPTMNNELLHFSIKNAPTLRQIWEKTKFFKSPYSFP